MKRGLRAGCFALGLGGAALLAACHTTSPALPPGVTKATRRIPLAGKTVSVDFYLPAEKGPAPVIIVAHGFTRGRRHMAGWGCALAESGMIAAIPDQPAWADAEKNGRALVELLDDIREKRVHIEGLEPGQKSAFVGFSMGGLTTLLAAAQTRTDAWVGLDPVDRGGLGKKAALGLKVPGAVIRAEPAPWNAHGNARQWIGAFGNPGWFEARVKSATHCDVESPTDWAARMACGPFKAKRHAVFERYTLAFLKATLLRDRDGLETLQQGGEDAELGSD